MTKATAEFEKFSLVSLRLIQIASPLDFATHRLIFTILEARESEESGEALFLFLSRRSLLKSLTPFLSRHCSVLSAHVLYRGQTLPDIFLCRRG